MCAAWGLCYAGRRLIRHGSARLGFGPHATLRSQSALAAAMGAQHRATHHAPMYSQYLFSKAKHQLMPAHATRAAESVQALT